MDLFDDVTRAQGDSQTIAALSACALIAMRQYMPSIKTVDDFEDNFDIAALYKVVEIASGIKLKEPEEPNNKDEGGQTWDSLDLAKLESEAFLLGIWKDYEELESSLSLQELISIVEAKRENDYQQNKFLAAIQGIDLDEQSGKKNAWEEMKDRVFNGNKKKSNDIADLKGRDAAQAGFGIGMGLSYERIG